MDTKSRQRKRRDGVLSSLNVAIHDMGRAWFITEKTLIIEVFRSAHGVLGMIKDTMASKTDYVDLGFACADVCRVLDRGVNGRRVDVLSPSVIEAIHQLTAVLGEVRKEIVKRRRWNAVCRLFQAKSDKEKITTWISDLNRILGIFNAELLITQNPIYSSALQGAVTTHVTG